MQTLVLSDDFRDLCYAKSTTTTLPTTRAIDVNSPVNTYLGYEPFQPRLSVTSSCHRDIVRLFLEKCRERRLGFYMGEKGERVRESCIVLPH